MPYLTAAVVLLAVLGTLNLLLTLAIVRRLRTMNPVQPPPEPLPVGTTIRPFTAATTDGETVSDRDLRGAQTLVGYFSPGCPPCEAALPRFVAYAAGLDRERVLAVIVDGTGSDAAGHQALEAVARVVVTSERATVVEALSAYGYPAVFLLDEDGRVAAVDTTVDGLPMVTAR
ncbi:thiol-disulfide isomerase/thioredoxin [Kribbella voronezhensis]|uniref:Thiol-disulfide isomerase/thioredoxin n=1 Tax=Kribbella voronezhensis TaxID=2512212 RepID=A0A4R7SZ28_9ACTN|nr:TlpA disulfide reductase family protein [Kribbella voronezhensis]TDU83986.1 thiol-disulfide isomerase/thioredoxin [Kribbella voronezhensis]